MNHQNDNVIHQYLNESEFQDRWQIQQQDTVDVLIPLIHTNYLWKKNLLSIYREIPVNRLLLGDGGCIDDSIVIAEQFPRVSVFDHRKIRSLGFSLRKLVEAVETEWFIYLHSDVYLPEGWFEAIKKCRKEIDWIESLQHFTVMVDYRLDYSKTRRPYSGAQMGRTDAFNDVISTIDDDYLYRNEDIVIAKLVEKTGHRYSLASDIFHYHQIMNNRTIRGREIERVEVITELSREEKMRTYEMQAKGLIKYLDPDKSTVMMVRDSLKILQEEDMLDWRDFAEWVKITNVKWLPFLTRIDRRPFRFRLRRFLLAARDLILG